MCDFCRKFDFGAARCEVDRYGARISSAGGSYRFPEHEQFNYCPVCGEARWNVKKEVAADDQQRRAFAEDKGACGSGH